MQKNKEENLAMQEKGFNAADPFGLSLKNMTQTAYTQSQQELSQGLMGSALDSTSLRVALLEDNLLESEAISNLLEENNCTVVVEETGQKFLELLKKDTFDLIILDWNLPDTDGHSILKTIRQNLKITRPILMITSRTSEYDVVIALNSGADDYLTKPWRPFELLARIGALMRRLGRVSTSGVQMRVDNFEMLNGSYIKLHHLDKTVLLKHKEFSLAWLLITNLGCAVSRAEIIDTIWLSEVPDSRTIDAHISKVRAKLFLTPEYGYSLSAIYGYGYRLSVHSANVETSTPIQPLPNGN